MYRPLERENPFLKPAASDVTVPGFASPKAPDPV
jgi:hypothetical protein